MAKAKLRLKARQLRNAGIGIKTIANKLKVSSSTASAWCRDIELSEKQIRELVRRAHDPYYGRRLEPISIPPFYACRGFLATLEMTV